MDKQRVIYRQLLVELFEKNFTAALFVEKPDTMMKVGDFELIRNEIEEETFTKNRGIKPYSDAIKYLCKKIEKCTADSTLFAAIEDYICAKDNIVVTKIAKGKTHSHKNTYTESKIITMKCNCSVCRLLIRINIETFSKRTREKQETKKNDENSRNIRWPC